MRKNPFHTVPFLEDQGFSVTDSHAITQYLVETRAPASTFIAHSAKEKALLNDRLYYDHFLFQKFKGAFVSIKFNFLTTHGAVIAMFPDGNLATQHNDKFFRLVQFSIIFLDNFVSLKF